MSKPLPKEKLDSIWWIGADGPDDYDFRELFGNDHPVEVDLGCGKGLFVFTESQRRPDVNFIGIDWSREYSRLAASRIVRNKIPNVRVIADNAWTLLPRFPDCSLHAIHVYFPDPWWKQRHRKRRIVSPALMEHVERLLVPGGLLALATDVEEYFGVMKRVVAGFPRLVPTADTEWSTSEGLTHFENKYRRQGKPIWRSWYKLQSADIPLGQASAPER